jgi:hypothetical protein
LLTSEHHHAGKCCRPDFAAMQLTRLTAQPASENEQDNPLYDGLRDGHTDQCDRLEPVVGLLAFFSRQERRKTHWVKSGCAHGSLSAAAIPCQPGKRHH